MTTKDTSSAASSPTPRKAERLAYINTGNQITFMHEGHSICVPRSKELLWNQVIDAMRKGTATSASLAALVQASDIDLKKVLIGTPELSFNADGTLVYNGFPVPATLATKLRDCIEQGFGAGPFVKFLANLVQNPREEVMEHLYAFLEYGEMAIDDEGYFLAYKAVREDYLDIYSGTFDNSIGAKPVMPAWAVDPDRHQTCSRGFHVCSFRYLPHFAHANGHVVVCRVNPKDVVAIPADYRNTKMRVSTYEVIDEFPGYYDKFPVNVLAARAVIPSGTSFEDEPFRLTIHFEHHKQTFSYPSMPTPESILSAIQEYGDDVLDVSSEEVMQQWRRYIVENSDTQETLAEVRNSEFAGEDDGSGQKYFILSHDTDADFEANDEEATLLGTFLSRKRATGALTELLVNESAFPGQHIALFMTDSCGLSLGDAQRLLRLHREG